MINPIESHFKESKKRIDIQSRNDELNYHAKQFFNKSADLKYSYNFNWLGRPIIQYPQDIIAFQEIVYEVKPDLIIETGIAHGGSLILSASLLSMIDVMEGTNLHDSKRKVIGIDIDIREHNRKEIDNHPLRKKITLIEGSSIDKKVINKVHELSKSSSNILVCLDSNHTHSHVLGELNAYAELVTKNSYCIVFDTVIQNMPPGSFDNRDWDIDNNPMTAVDEWIKVNPDFVINEEIDKKLLISVNPRGYLYRKCKDKN